MLLGYHMSEGGHQMVTHVTQLPQGKRKDWIGRRD